MATYTLKGTITDERRDYHLTFNSLMRHLRTFRECIILKVEPNLAYEEGVIIEITFIGPLRYQSRITAEMIQYDMNHEAAKLNYQKRTLQISDWTTIMNRILTRYLIQAQTYLRGISVGGSGGIRINLLIFWLLHHGVIDILTTADEALTYDYEQATEMHDLISKIRKLVITYVGNGLPQFGNEGITLPTTKRFFKFDSNGTNLNEDIDYNLWWSLIPELNEPDLLLSCSAQYKAYHVVSTYSYPHLHIFSSSRDWDAYYLLSFIRTLRESILSSQGQSNLHRIMNIPINNVTLTPIQDLVLRGGTMITTVTALTQIPSTTDECLNLLKSMELIRAKTRGRPIVEVEYLLEYIEIAGKSNYEYNFCDELIPIVIERPLTVTEISDEFLPFYHVISAFPFGEPLTEENFPPRRDAVLNTGHDLGLQVDVTQLFNVVALTQVFQNLTRAPENITTNEVIQKINSLLRTPYIASSRTALVSNLTSEKTFNELFRDVGGLNILKPLVAIALSRFLTGSNPIVNYLQGQGLNIGQTSEYRLPPSRNYNLISTIFDFCGLFDWLYFLNEDGIQRYNYTALSDETPIKKNVLLVGIVDDASYSLLNQAFARKISLQRASLNMMIGSTRVAPRQADRANNVEMVIINMMEWRTADFEDDFDTILDFVISYLQDGIPYVAMRFPGWSTDMNYELVTRLNDNELLGPDKYSLVVNNGYGALYIGITPIVILMKASNGIITASTVEELEILRQFTGVGMDDQALTNFINVIDMESSLGSPNDYKNYLIHGASTEEDAGKLLNLLLSYSDAIRVYRTDRSKNSLISMFGIITQARLTFRKRFDHPPADSNLLISPTRPWEGDFRLGNWYGYSSMMRAYDLAMKENYPYDDDVENEAVIDIGGRMAEGLRFCSNEDSVYVNIDPNGAIVTNNDHARIFTIQESFTVDMNIDALEVIDDYDIQDIKVIALNSITFLTGREQIVELLGALGRWLGVDNGKAKTVYINYAQTPTELDKINLNSLGDVYYPTATSVRLGTYDPIPTFTRAEFLLALSNNGEVPLTAVDVNFELQNYIKAHYTTLSLYGKYNDIGVPSIVRSFPYLLVERVSE